MIAGLMVRGLMVTLMVCCAGAAGCRSGAPAAYRSSATISVDAQSPSGEVLWEGIKDTLRGDHFTLDQVDRRGGVITTRPELSRHFFEFWRRDARTFSDKLEASINPIRRWIEVRFDASGETGETALAVVVHKQRLSSPDRMFNSSGAAYQFFSETLPSTTGAPRVTAADERWLDLGRDAALEDYFLRKFEKLASAAGAPAAAQAPPAEPAAVESATP